MLNMQESSGALMTHSPLKYEKQVRTYECSKNSWQNVHNIVRNCTQQSLPPDQGRTKAAEWQGLQGKRQPVSHLCWARAAGTWVAAVGTDYWEQSYLRGRVWGDAVGTIHSIAGEDNGPTTGEHNSTLLWPTAGNGHYSLTLKISLHYSLLGLHACNIPYLVSREISGLVWSLVSSRENN